MLMTFMDKLIFLTQLLFIEGLFLYRQNKKSGFVLKLILCITLCCLVAIYLPNYLTGMSHILRYFLTFLLTLLGMGICFQMTLQEIIFIGVASYDIQHGAYCLSNILTITLYQQDIDFLIWLQNDFISYIIFAIPIVILLKRKVQNYSQTETKSKTLLALSAAILTITVILNYIRVLYLDIGNTVMQFSFLTYAFFSCVLALTLQFGLLERSKLKQEVHLLEYLWRQDKKQYEIEKTNIDLINVKCHDMKHQIASLRANAGDIEQQALNDMDQAISIYDSFAKTGNTVLDTILSQKLLFCAKKGITMTYMVDGSALDFIETIDLYSIMGNIIDNAVESVQELKEAQYRIIGLKVITKNHFLTIHIENYYNHTIHMDNGLPTTTKGDLSYHGFGLKSVKKLITKYDGNMTINTENNIFSLNILLPISLKSV